MLESLASNFHVVGSITDFKNICQVMQFLESQEYNMFTRIVFDTAPTVRKTETYFFNYITRSAVVLMSCCAGPYTATFVIARLLRCIHWEDIEGTF